MKKSSDQVVVPDALWRLAAVLAEIASTAAEGGEMGDMAQRALPH